MDRQQLVDDLGTVLVPEMLEAHGQAAAALQRARASVDTLDSSVVNTVTHMSASADRASCQRADHEFRQLVAQLGSLFDTHARLSAQTAETLGWVNQVLFNPRAAQQVPLSTLITNCTELTSQFHEVARRARDITFSANDSLLAL